VGYYSQELLALGGGGGDRHLPLGLDGGGEGA
jgi:hypothetical protein